MNSDLDMSIHQNKEFPLPKSASEKIGPMGQLTLSSSLTSCLCLLPQTSAQADTFTSSYNTATGQNCGFDRVLWRKTMDLGCDLRLIGLLGPVQHHPKQWRMACEHLFASGKFGSSGPIPIRDQQHTVHLRQEGRDVIML